jgi:hypothetical protein
METLHASNWFNCTVTIGWVPNEWQLPRLPVHLGNCTLAVLSPLHRLGVVQGGPSKVQAWSMLGPSVLRGGPGGPGIYILTYILRQIKRIDM